MKIIPKWLDATGQALGRILVAQGDGTVAWGDNSASGDDTFVLSAGRDATVTNSYLRGPGDIFTNLVPIVLPYDATLVAMSLATRGNESWTAELRVGGTLVTGATLNVTADDEAYATGYSASFSAGDGVQFYVNGSGIRYPMINAFFKRT